VGHIRNMTGIRQRNLEGDLALDPVLRLVDDTSFDCIIVIDMVGVIQHVNITTLSEFGYDFRDEFIGNNISILVGGGHATKHAKYMDRFQKKEKSETVIGKRRALKSLRKDGSEFSCIIAINTIPESDCLIGIIRNVTGVSRKHKTMEADDLSAKGKQHAEDFLDDSFDSIIVANEDGIILRVNQTALETFRYGSKDELIGHNMSILMGGGEDKNHDKYLANFKKAGTSQSTIGRQRLLLSRRKDGTDFPCVIGIRRMRNSSNLVGFIRDVSEVSQHNENVIEITNINQLDPVGRLIDDQSFDCIIVIDRKGTITQLNQTTVTEFGYASKADIEGIHFSVLVGSGHAEIHNDLNRLIELSTIGKQRMLLLRRNDGTEFQGVVAIREITDTELFVGYIRNMTGIPQQDTPKSSLHIDVLGHIDDTSFDSIVVTDKDGVIQCLNVTTLSDFGYASKDELVGKNISVLVGGGHAENHGRYVERFYKMGRSNSVIGKQRILHSRRKDGSEFPCLIGIKMLPNTDLMIGYIRNMTGFSKKQKAVEADNLSQSVDSTDTTEDDSGSHQEQSASI
jgi:PAS domain S-box-containing protein